MKLNRILSMLLLLNILLASCATLEVGVETTQPAQPTAAATATMEIAQAARPTEIQSPMPTATVTEAAPAITLAPTAGSPATGLVYRLGDQVWQINADGNPVAMAAALDPQILPGQFTPRAVVFDGGRWMVSWWDWSDLWAVDLGSGQVRNITNTPSQEECCAQFWAARPDVLIFQSRLIETGGLASGFLATVNLDGSNYRILDETEGFVKIICENKNDTLLGASIIGPRATELIGILTLGLKSHLKVSQIKETVFAHPTLSESISESLKDYHGI